ncbi:MAG: DUF1761 domain-containing protein [Actinobacteria bacterium]|jgi:hypothetical protein|nr:DUF1761 domain-containing protein [Actinomycetota bacterium]
MTVVIPWLGVLLAVVAAFLVGSLYFGPKTMFPVWWRAMGRTADDQPGGSMGLVFGLTALGALVQALTLSWLLQASASLYGDADVTPGHGLLVGALVGAGIAAAASLSHRMFAGHGVVVWAIESIGDVLQLAVMGLVLSFFL